jgi:Arc/MetJ-type ribon-helix-helix transcriptional regulator
MREKLIRIKRKNQDARVSTRLSLKQRKQVERKIQHGEYQNLSQFLRVSIERELAA